MGTPHALPAGARPATSHRQLNKRLIMGGPMMGFTVPQPGCTGGQGHQLHPGAHRARSYRPRHRHRPVSAVACAPRPVPASLLPQQMYWFAQGKEFEKLEQHNLFDCIECGACSYVCPSNIPAGAVLPRLQGRDTEAAQRLTTSQSSREPAFRSPAGTRLAREEAEKEAKRAARKKAAEEKAGATGGGEHRGDSEEDPIQAAIERAKAKKAAQQAECR